MYVDRVVIHNVRGFGGELRSVDLDFARPDGSYSGWTVLAGRNGSGKTTFLRAIALAIGGPSVARALGDSGYSGWINRGSDFATAEVRLTFDNVDTFTSGGRLPAKAFWAGLRWDRTEGPEPSLDEDLSRNSTAKLTARRGPWTENPSGWFLAGYGPYRRLSQAGSEAQRAMVGPRRVASLVSLFLEEASLVEGVRWLQDQLLRSLEAEKANTGSGPSQLLRDVLAVLGDGLLPDGMRIDAVTSNGLVVRNTDGEIFTLEDMSDGYRTVAAVVVDIMRRLHDYYGTVDVHDTPGGPVVKSAGVVLIDEIDVHLHVTWQQKIGHWLKTHFPNIQFIVSTHSPFVCQAADPNGLIRLPAPGETGAAIHVADGVFQAVVLGAVDVAAMSELFGMEHTRSEEAIRLRGELASLEAKAVAGSLDAAGKERIQQLRLVLPATLSDDVAEAVRRAVAT